MTSFGLFKFHAQILFEGMFQLYADESSKVLAIPFIISPEVKLIAAVPRQSTDAKFYGKPHGNDVEHIMKLCIQFKFVLTLCSSASLESFQIFNVGLSDKTLIEFLRVHLKNFIAIRASSFVALFGDVQVLLCRSISEARA